MKTIKSKSCFQNLSILLILTISLNNFERAHSWLPSLTALKINHRHPNPPSPYQHRQQQAHYLPSSVSPVPSSTRLYRVIIDPIDFPLGKDEDAWKVEGERIIKNAVVEAGASIDQIKIQWKAGKIIVTVKGGYAAVKPRDESDVGEEEFGDMNFDTDATDTDTDTDTDTVTDDNTVADDDDEGLKESPPDKDEGANVISIARKINNAFAEEGEESVGFRIAVHHSVEVTTPGASDELDGIMFKAYKGFDVMVEMIDSKTKKMKIVEGKLVDRNEDTTTINQKGRLRKIKNYNVQSVKLPKAKREKRGR